MQDSGIGNTLGSEKRRGDNLFSPASCLTGQSEDLISMEKLERVAPIIRNLAHPVRLRILDYLNLCGEPKTVSEIIEAAGTGQAIVSQQLRILRDQGILSAQRDGNFIRYEIADRSVLPVLDCIRNHT